jgi:hypothetical protein
MKAVVLKVIKWVYAVYDWIKTVKITNLASSLAQGPWMTLGFGLLLSLNIS